MTRDELMALVERYGDARLVYAAGEIGIEERQHHRAALVSALDALLADAEAGRRELLALAKLAADTPEFFNPLDAFAAQAIRDRILADARVPGGARDDD